MTRTAKARPYRPMLEMLANRIQLGSALAGGLGLGSNLLDLPDDLLNDRDRARAPAGHVAFLDLFKDRNRAHALTGGPFAFPAANRTTPPTGGVGMAAPSSPGNPVGLGVNQGMLPPNSSLGGQDLQPLGRAPQVIGNVGVPGHSAAPVGHGAAAPGRAGLAAPPALAAAPAQAADVRSLWHPTNLHTTPVRGRGDGNHPLDPSATWVSYYGGAYRDGAKAVVAGGGNVYLAGYRTITPGKVDAFVASFTDDGTTLNWVTLLTSPDNGLRDEVHGLALDPTGTTLYAVGFFGTGTVGKDGFVERLDAATGAEGTVYTFSNGTLDGVTADADGNVFVAGWQTPTSGTATTGTLVAKFDAALDAPPVYATLFTFGTGGSINSTGKSIAVDAAGNAYVGGTYQATATDTQGDYLRVKADGSSLDWQFTITNVTPGPNGSVNGVAFSGGFLYLTGTYHNDGSNPDRVLKTDLLIAKVDAATGSTTWIFRYAAPLDGDWGGFGIQVNSMGNAYVGGHYFDQTGISPGGTDARAWKFATNGGSIISDIILAGSENDDGYAIALGTAPDDVFFAGISASNDFPTTPGVYQETYGGGVSNGFFARLLLTP